MLLRHSAYYLLARGIPGIINFGALAVYTRLLAPEEFGRYATVLAGVGLANVVIFQWLRLVLGRFYPAAEHQDDPKRFLAGILAIFLTLAVAVTGVGVLLALWLPDPAWQRLLALAVPLLLAQAWFELNLRLATARLEPSRYGRLLGSKAVIALTVGGVLAWIGFGAAAPLIGLLVAHFIAFLLFAFLTWQGVGPRWPEAALLRAQLRYGLPLTVTFALGWVVSGSDRLLLAWLIDERTVGVYTAGYDLAFQSLTLFLIIINTAASPLAINALEKQGTNEARLQLAQNGELIIAAALAGAVGLVILGAQLVALLIGEEFRAEALLVLPWVAVAAALAGVKSYYFDFAFHLGRNSRLLVITGAIAAIVNLVLNVMLIPKFGMIGAAWATLTAFGVGAAASAWFGRRAFNMPAMMPLLVKGSFIAFIVGLATWLSSSMFETSEVNWAGFVAGLIFGALAALIAALVVNLSNLRAALKRY